MNPHPSVTAAEPDHTSSVELVWENEGGHPRRADPLVPRRPVTARAGR